MTCGESMSYEIPTATPDPPADGARKASHVVVTDGEAGQRLDNWLIRTLKGLPRSLVYRLLRTGQVRVNGKRAKPDQRVAAGDSIRLPPQRDSAPPAAATAGPRAVPASLTELVAAAIVREEKDVLVIDKPAGVAVHGGSGLAFGVIEALRALRPDEELELVHRLDRETSGLLLVARNRRALRELHAAFREGRVEKRYLALVKGQWNLGKTTVDVPLATRQKQGGERMVRVHESGKDARSTFEGADFFGARATLMAVSIDTGRTHQIRVHAAHAGHPVAGDPKYGDRAFNEEMRELGLERMFLHAQSVSLDWPGTGRTFQVSVPLPPELAAVIDRLSVRRPRARR
jgi:23S rRNA pseudouridine955/2504/2580 synthase